MPSLRSVARTKLFRAVVACLLLGGLAWAFRAPLLRGTARLWIVDEPPAPAAAIVVLGGGEDYRPFAAAKLWKEGFAPVILVPQVQPSPTEALGLRPTTTQIILGVLKAEGVPDSAVRLYGHDVSSTREEALGVREWWEREGEQGVNLPLAAGRAGDLPAVEGVPPVTSSASPRPETKDEKPETPRRLLIPTDPFPTRRTNWLFEKTLPPELDVRVVVTDHPKYTPANWWQHEEGLIQFQNEVIKWMLYRTKY